MTTRRRMAVACFVGGITLLAVAFFLAVHNPRITGTSRGETYTCLAPWDTSLHHASNFPGGEPPPDAQQIAARCRAAGRKSFRTGVLVGMAGLGAFAGGARLGRRHP